MALWFCPSVQHFCFVRDKLRKIRKEERGTRGNSDEGVWTIELELLTIVRRSHEIDAAVLYAKNKKMAGWSTYTLKGS